MNQQDIEQVVKAVLLKMQSSDTPPAAVHEMGVFASLDDAVAAAKVAQQGLKSVAMRQLAIAAIREAGEKHARDLAELAVSETGMGRVEDKFAKNVAQARGTPGVECLSPQVLTGDNGLTLIDRDRTDDAGAARRARRQRGGCHCAGGETGRRLPPHGGNALAQYRKHEPDGERH